MDREKIERQLRYDEGVKLYVYLDSAMIPTVGIGHKVLPSDGLSVGERISEDKLMDFYNHDLLHAEIGARNSVKNFEALPSEIQDVLIELCFNLGTAGLRKFKNMLASVEKQDWNKMAYHLLDSKAARDLPMRYKRYATRIKEVAV